LFRLALSARCTGATGFGLLPTPVHTDHKNQFTVQKGRNPNGEYLRIAVRTMWPTPGAADEKWRYSTLEAARRRAASGKQIGLECAAHLGATLSGQSAQTEKPGALNPQFVCWLMGFPPEWDACAPTEMPSSRKSRRK
jgi:hypothetical protein